MTTDIRGDLEESLAVGLEGAGFLSARHPREAAPTQPMLLVGPKEIFDAAGITKWLEEHSWPSVWAADADRAKWLACIQRISIVAVVGDNEFVWPLVQSIRPVTDSPLVVFADPPAPGVVALVAAGVDAVINPLGGPDEMFARLVALLRRLDDSWEPGVRYLVADGLRVDLWSQQCENRGQPLHLSPTEYSLLTFLMTHPTQALASSTIVRKVWGWPPTDGRNALRIFVNRLRRKLDDDSRRPSFIESVRGTGYRFVRNVVEIADSAQRSTETGDVTPLLNALESLATGLLACDSVAVAAEHLLTCVDSTGYVDAVAVFRVDGKVMSLVAQRHMPEWWLEMVSPGVPLRHSFASAHSVMTGETVAFGDVAAAGQRFTSTAQHLLPGDYHAGMFVPLLLGERVWGHIGLVRRSRQSFDFTGTSFFRSATATFNLALRRFEG